MNSKSASTLVLIISYCLAAHSQVVNQPSTLRPNKEVKVAYLPSKAASSEKNSAVLAATLETAIMQPDVCCDRDSALEPQIPPARNLSLKDLGDKLQGKHYLGTGLPIVVATQYWSGASTNVQMIIGTLMQQRPLIMDWNGRLYVLYGATYDEYVDNSGNTEQVIKTLLLIDTRYSDARRNVTFNRQTDDWAKVNGLLSLTITR
jgi:hypothetical protein